jgi:hypothetical protein
VRPIARPATNSPPHAGICRSSQPLLTGGVFAIIFVHRENGIKTAQNNYDTQPHQRGFAAQFSVCHSEEIFAGDKDAVERTTVFEIFSFFPLNSIEKGL